MSHRAARVRTESMVQRLSKKPLSEGFDLWDRGFTLGAMRLFIFKAETSLPFQLAPCLDAIAHLLLNMDESDDAREHFQNASEKYDLVQQPLQAALMGIKAVDAAEGQVAALEKINDFILKHDASRNAHAVTDLKTKTGLARAYYIRADLAYQVSEKSSSEALQDAEYSASLGWDRAHLAEFLVGRIKEAAGDVQGAIEAYDKTITMNVNYIAAYEALVPLLKTMDPDRAIGTLERAIVIHPKSSLIREKVFMISEAGKDVEALAYLDHLIAHPPQEEAQSGAVLGNTTLATLFKTKAAVLADGGKLQEALVAAEEASRICPTDEEALHIISDIKGSM